jgi:hypothetical protein
MKHELGNLHLSEQIPSPLINDEKLKDSEGIADAFNTTFLTIIENLNLHQEVRGDAILFLKEALPRKFPGIKIIPATETEMKSIMHSLKTRNSSGYDLMTSKILKVFASLISYPLTHIFNHLLFTGIFRDCLKISIVRVYKRRQNYYDKLQANFIINYCL